ncbi:MAG TPA: 5'-nucleotidase C-terminal domain-containing protein [Gemmatimonadaceae bacterium]|jgi:2',3'-cyclic-nucleotide 2'-phosphodiesterase/3'-nucleotidase
MRIITASVAGAAAVLLGIAACTRGPLLQSNVSADVVIAATTDIHGRVRGWDYYLNAPDTLRGLTRIGTIIDSLRRVSRLQPVVIDAGDIIQGNPLAFAAARIDSTIANPVIAAMNKIDYDAAVVGNHEFNYGLKYLDKAVREAQFPLLATNVYQPDGTRKFRSWSLSSRLGVRIAVVGATTPGSMVWDRDNLNGKLEVRDIVPEVRAAVRDARGSGADVVVVALHSGLNEPSSYDTVSTKIGSENVAARVAKEVPGIDLIVYGHSHKEMADTMIGTTLLMQPKNWAQSVAIAHLRVEGTRSRGFHVTAHRSTLVQAHGHTEEPQVLAATQEGHRAGVAYATQTVGSTSQAWRADSGRVIDSPLIDFILSVEQKATGAQLASTAIFDRGASVGPGAITVAQLAALYPYDNTLRAVRITGAQLRAYLEQSARYFRKHDGVYDTDPEIPGFNYDVVSGVDYTIDIDRPSGERITKLQYQGRDVLPTDSFTMALNNYRQTGGGGFSMLRDAPVVYDHQQEIRQLLIDEVRARGTFKPNDYFQKNWQLLPAAAIAPLLRIP